MCSGTLLPGFSTKRNGNNGISVTSALFDDSFANDAGRKSGVCPEEDCAEEDDDDEGELLKYSTSGVGSFDSGSSPPSIPSAPVLHRMVAANRRARFATDGVRGDVACVRAVNNCNGTGELNASCMTKT